MNIKYPNGMIKEKTTLVKKKTKNMQKSHLGLSFEEAINDSNEYYRNNNIAVIYKKPTPIQVVKVDYPSRNKAKITEAFYKIPSTTDYNGMYKGNYIDFEAKSCNENSFSFQRIYVHQIEHLRKIHEHGGISFLLIEFSQGFRRRAISRRPFCGKPRRSLPGFAPARIAPRRFCLQIQY